MKLAEALSVRADLQKRVSQIQGRLNSCVKVQEGDSPAEAPADIILELKGYISQLEDLIVRINRTNQQTVLEDGRTITEMIARRDLLTTEVRIRQNALSCATERENRYSRQEIRFVSTIDVACG